MQWNIKFKHLGVFSVELRQFVCWYSMRFTILEPVEEFFHFNLVVILYFEVEMLETFMLLLCVVDIKVFDLMIVLQFCNL